MSKKLFKFWRFFLVLISIGFFSACAINPKWQSPENSYTSQEIIPNQTTAVMTVASLETKGNSAAKGGIKRWFKEHRLKIAFCLSQDRAEAVGGGIIFSIESKK